MHTPAFTSSISDFFPCTCSDRLHDGGRYRRHHFLTHCSNNIHTYSLDLHSSATADSEKTQLCVRMGATVTVYPWELNGVAVYQVWELAIHETLSWHIKTGRTLLWFMQCRNSPKIRSFVIRYHLLISAKVSLVFFFLFSHVFVTDAA